MKLIQTVFGKDCHEVWKRLKWTNAVDQPVLQYTNKKEDISHILTGIGAHTNTLQKKLVFCIIQQISIAEECMAMFLHVDLPERYSENL